MPKGANRSRANRDRPWQPLQKKVYYQQCTQSPYPGDTRSMALLKMSLRGTFTLLFWLNTAKQVFVAFYVHRTPDITKMGLPFWSFSCTKSNAPSSIFFLFSFRCDIYCDLRALKFFFLSRHDLSGVITAWENLHPMGVCRRLGKTSAFLSGAS